jgi:trehalose 6-phosphate synthase
MGNPGRAPLVVASNRGPLSIVAVDDGDDEVRRGGGGLVSGMQAALSSAPDAVWICAALNDRERAISRRATSGRLSEVPAVADALAGDFDVRMLPIDALTFRQAYNGIANSTLWFLLHMLYEPARSPLFDQAWRRQWAGYVRYNLAFAEAVAAEAASGATVMIQDYHLLLAPRMLRAARPDVRIGHFTHTPWAPPEYFRMLPDDVVRDLLDGLLGADLVGFHTNRWGRHFADCCYELLGRRPGSRLGIFPLSTDADELRERAFERDVNRALRELRDTVGERKIIGRVDRTELSKNVLRGLLAYRELLRTRPEWHGRVVHVVYNYPSREDLPEYREYTATVERVAREIDDEFSTDDWTPLVLEIGDDYPGSLAAMRMSDVIFVNSVLDGMNLVVQEGIVLSERDPAVVLSRDAGAADTLGDDALLINPFDVSQTAAALHEALAMPDGERVARVRRLREKAVALPPVPWFRAQVDALNEVSGVSD